MHVVSPERYRNKPVVTQHHKRKPVAAWLLLVLIVLGTANYLRPLPAATVSLHLPTTPAVTQPVINWPAAGQSAVAVQGYGLLGTSGAQQPLATASIAKVITALCVLEKQPLDVGQSGPTYTVDANDVNLYEEYAEQNGSVIPVEDGETMSESQALEAMMIPSANNVADSLVRWVFGSQTAYVDYATSFLRAHGLNQTTIGSDASGYDSSTISTASDLATLGLLTLKSPVLMQIASLKSVTLPVVGTVSNYDTVLGQNGIVGIKTGNNDADPGAFLFAARHNIAGHDIYITGAVLGQADLDTALQAATVLSDSAQEGFQQIVIATSKQNVGTVQTAWGETADIQTASSVSLLRWGATPVTESHVATFELGKLTIGNLKAVAGPASSKSNLVLSHALTKPSFWWRVTRH
jgi:D-alanyl-D-alanine carboxypeptidase (penicillin-binding protein 5/6)